MHHDKRLMLATLAPRSCARSLGRRARLPRRTTPAAFDSRWNPYLGCWPIVQEHRGRSVPVPRGTDGLRAAVRPSGVAVTTTVDGKNVLEQTIVADGSAQPVSQADCRAHRPATGRATASGCSRASSSTCAGRPKRVVSGITQLAKGHWVDAQATVIDGDHDVRLRRYQRTSDQMPRRRAHDAGAPMSVEDVIEASEKVLSARSRPRSSKRARGSRSTAARSSSSPTPAFRRTSSI